MMIDICQEPDMPHRNSVYNWVTEDREGFADRYQKARLTGFQARADRLFAIVDDRSNVWVTRCKEDGTVETIFDSLCVARARLQFDAQRWILPRVLPGGYGDRQERQARTEGESDMAELMKLLNGRSRGLPSEDRPLDESEDEPLDES